MHARWLTEIASLAVLQSTKIYSRATPFPSTPLNDYWLANRERVQVWQTNLQAHRESIERAGASQRVRLWKQVRPTLEEIFLSDLLVRTMAAIASSLEVDQIDCDAGPITQNVWMTHEEARNRALRLLTTPGVPVDQAVELNRIRHALERWTDQTLSFILPACSVGQFAFSREDLEDLRSENSEVNDTECEASGSQGFRERFVRWQLMANSLQRWTLRLCKSPPVADHWNRRIGDACLGLILPDSLYQYSPTETFLPPSNRMEALMSQAKHWLDELLT